LNPNIGRAPGNRLLHLNTQRLIDIEDYILQLPQKPLELMGSKNNPINNLFSTLSSIGVYLIKEQRRLESINIPGMFTDPQMRSFSHKIQRYAIELGNLIHQKQMAAYQESQKLDSSFPSRLIQLGRRLSQSEFDDRLKVLSKKQQQLQQYGIAISNIQMPKYDKNNENDVKVLSIYLEDSEKKACFFDDLVAKINLFVDIINKKDFSLNKKININGNSGFSFETNQGEKLNLALLSSGEQEEVILLYELIFRARPNTLVLIDEPETSLHVTWQKEFVNDLFAIAKLQPISFLLATHSPSIVDGRWDIAPDLFDLANGEEDLEND
jgi:predicted ATP-binding protein involved in virulence